MMKGRMVSWILKDNETTLANKNQMNPSKSENSASAFDSSMHEKSGVSCDSE